MGDDIPGTVRDDSFRQAVTVGVGAGHDHKGKNMRRTRPERRTSHHGLKGLLGLCIVSLLLVAATTAGLGQTAPPTVTDYGLTDLLLSPYQGQTGYNLTRSNQQNTFSAPITQVGPAPIKWQSQKGDGLIPGAMTIWAPVSSPNGKHVWWTQSRGLGYSSVQQLDAATGAVLFQTPPYDGTANTVNGLIGSQVNVDLDGNAYFMDDQNVWSYTDAGVLRWKRPLRGTGITKPWNSNATFTNEGWIGSVTQDGWWLFLDRATGQIVLQQKYPPSRPLPCPTAIKAVSIATALVSGNFSAQGLKTLGCGAIDLGVSVKNTLAYDPTLGYMFQQNVVSATAGAQIAAFKMVDGPTGKRIEQVWSAPTSQRVLTASPTVFIKGRKIFASVGDDGHFGAFDELTGRRLWVTGEGGYQPLLTPQIDEFGNMVLSQNLNELHKISVDDGHIIWRKNYDSIAPLANLPQGPRTPIVPDGTPRTFIVAPTQIGPNSYSLAMSFGYNTRLGQNLPRLSNLFGFSEGWPIVKKDATVLVDPDTGDVIPGSVTFVKNGRGANGEGAAINGVVGPDTNGWNYVSETEGVTLANWLFLNPLVPEIYQTPVPSGGVWGAESDHLQMAIRQIQDNSGWNSEALRNLRGSGQDLQRSFDLIRRIPNLDPGALVNIESARTDRQVNGLQALLANSAVHRAADLQQLAKRELLGTPTATNVSNARSLIVSANRALAEALIWLPKADTITDGATAGPVAAVRSTTRSVPTVAASADTRGDVTDDDITRLAELMGGPSASSGASAAPAGDLTALRNAIVAFDPTLTAEDLDQATLLEVQRMLDILTRPILGARDYRALQLVGRFAPEGGDQYAMQGLRTLFVVPLGFYDRLGLRAGDVVLSVNGIPMTSAAQTQKAADAFATAGRVSVVVKRGPITFTINRVLV